MTESAQTQTDSGASIFLVGPMGVGKSTVGRQLAKRLQREFHDSDQTIEARTGVDIPLIFEFEGEEGFRRRERQVLDELTALDSIVLATGGGAVLDPDNRTLLAKRGLVVYLRANPEQLLERTIHDQHRPLLQTPDRLGRIRELLAERDVLYRGLADLTIDTDRLTVRRSVNAICKKLQTEI
ncbi:MAG: shikimate kinase AroK [Gammaproteobacteria bacterium]